LFWGQLGGGGTPKTVKTPKTGLVEKRPMGGRPE